MNYIYEIRLNILLNKALNNILIRLKITEAISQNKWCVKKSMNRKIRMNKINNK